MGNGQSLQIYPSWETGLFALTEEQKILVKDQETFHKKLSRRSDFLKIKSNFSFATESMSDEDIAKENRRRDLEFTNRLREYIKNQKSVFDSSPIYFPRLFNRCIKHGFMQGARLIFPYLRPEFRSDNHEFIITLLKDSYPEFAWVKEILEYKLAPQLLEGSLKTQDEMMKKLAETPVVFSDSASEEIAKKDLEFLRSKIDQTAKYIKPESASFYRFKGIDYLAKTNGVESKFATDLFRILSQKKFSTKGEILIVDEVGGILNGIKMDDSLSAKNLFEFDFVNQQNIELLKGYARLCGVLQIFGEYDYNPRNFLINECGRVVKIDHSFFVDLFNSDQKKKFGIYGSPQSNIFLRKILAGECSSRDLSTFNLWKDCFEERVVVMPQDGDFAARNKRLVALNQDGLDATEVRRDLLRRLKLKINKPENEHLKIAFIEFMQGMSDAIELGENEEFLNSHAEKLSREIFENIPSGLEMEFIKLLIANVNKDLTTCKKFYQQNVAQAKEEFADFLSYFRELTCDDLLEKALEDFKEDGQPSAIMTIEQAAKQSASTLVASDWCRSII